MIVRAGMGDYSFYRIFDPRAWGTPTIGPGGLPTYCTDWRRIFYRDADICRNPPVSIVAPPPAPSQSVWTVPPASAETAQQTVDAIIAAQKEEENRRIAEFYRNVPEQAALPWFTNFAGTGLFDPTSLLFFGGLALAAIWVAKR